MSDKYRYRWGPKVSRSIEKTGTIAVELGDMVKFTSAGKVTPVGSSSDALQLIGVSLTKSPTTDKTATVLHILEVGHGTVFGMTVASGTAYTVGDNFVISGAQTLTKITRDNPLSTGTNVVAYCVQDMSAAGTTVLVAFGIGRLGAQISGS